MLKAIIFDIDNTLIDFMEMKKRACSAAMRAMIAAGLKLDFDTGIKMLYEIYSEHTIEYHEVFQDLFAKLGNGVNDRMIAHGVVAYREARVPLPYGDVSKILDKLKQEGYKLAILTDAPSLKAWIRLVKMDIDSFFDVVLTVDDTGVEKPDKKAFEAVLRKLELKAADCLMVGDNMRRDMAGAKAMGIKTCFAKYGSIEEVKYSGADFDILKVEDVLEVVNKIKMKKM